MHSQTNYSYLENNTSRWQHYIVATKTHIYTGNTFGLLVRAIVQCISITSKWSIKQSIVNDFQSHLYHSWQTLSNHFGHKRFLFATTHILSYFLHVFIPKYRDVKKSTYTPSLLFAMNRRISQYCEATVAESSQVSGDSNPSLALSHHHHIRYLYDNFRLRSTASSLLFGI